MSAKLVVGVSATVFAGMVILWGLAGSNSSSTAGLTFLWGWLVGIPAAILLLVAAERTPLRREPPPPSGELPRER